MSLTIGETIQQLHGALQDYIEAAYHVSHPTLVAQRQEILRTTGVIHQRPYLESTPRYKTGKAFKDLGLDSAALEVFGAVSETDGDLNRLIYDPPYEHQAVSTKLSLVDGRSLVVMTGTGSGKTECFLLPILGKLATEAQRNGQAFGQTPAVRAMVLYPMNALVNDQLGRLRLLFADQRISDRFIRWSGRPARFARYTSRTLYPGVRDSRKDQTRLAPIRDYYINNLEIARDPLFSSTSNCQGTDPGTARAGQMACKTRPDQLVRSKRAAMAGLEDWRLQESCDATRRSGVVYTTRSTSGASRHLGDELLDAGVHDDAPAGKANL